MKQSVQEHMSQWPIPGLDVDMYVLWEFLSTVEIQSTLDCQGNSYFQVCFFWLPSTFQSFLLSPSAHMLTKANFLILFYCYYQ